MIPRPPSEKQTSRWEAVALVLLLILVAVAVASCLAGCFGRGISPDDAAKLGGGVGAFFGPWGSLIGAGVAYATALAARKIERGRMLAVHEQQVDSLTRTINALRETAVTSPAAKYPPSDQLPNGTGLDPHA